MKKFEIYQRKNYKNLFYLQNILEDFYYFNSLNENNECIRNHLIRKIGTKEFRKTNKYVNYKVKSIFNSLEEFFQSCIDNKMFVTFVLDETEISGIIHDIYEEIIVLDVFEFSAEQNGVSLIHLFDVNEIMWNGMHEKKLEKYSVYNKEFYNTNEILNICSKGQELCEVYRQGNVNMFLVGLSKKLDDNYFLIETIDLIGNPNGYVLIHQELIDYFCFKTKYLNIYQNITSKNNWTKFNSFLEYLKESRQSFYFSDYKGREYYNVTLKDYNDKYFFFTKGKKNHHKLICHIDVIDARRK